MLSGGLPLFVLKIKEQKIVSWAGRGGGSRKPARRSGGRRARGKERQATTSSEGEEGAGKSEDREDVGSGGGGRGKKTTEEIKGGEAADHKATGARKRRPGRTKLRFAAWGKEGGGEKILE
jgi:hypothetical protein